MELYELGNWTKIYLEKGTYILSKNVFLIFWEIELSSGRLKKFQEKTFRAERNITLWKNFLYFGKWNFLARSLKSSYIFSKRFKIMQKISWPLIFFYYIVNVFPNVHRFNKKFFFFDDKIHTFSFLKIYAICYLSWKEYA